MSLENPDLQARQDIEKIKEEQYAQSELLKATKDCCEANSKRLDEILPEHKRRIGDLERRFTDCDTKHETHTHHRRKSDQEMSVIATTLQQSLKVSQETKDTMEKMLKLVEEHAPTVKRAKDNHTFWDKSKELLILIAIVYGALHGAEQIASFFK